MQHFGSIQQENVNYGNVNCNGGGGGGGLQASSTEMIPPIPKPP